MKPNNANKLLAGLSLLGIRRGYNERVSPELGLSKELRILELMATDPELGNDVPSAVKVRVLDLLVKNGIQMSITEGQIRWQVEL